MYVPSLKKLRKNSKKIRKKQKMNMNSLAEKCLMLKLSLKDNSTNFNLREKDKDKLCSACIGESLKKLRTKEFKKLRKVVKN